MCKVSVVMSVYNGEKYLRQSIESILTQTYHDFEFIIVNDHSNDETVKILEGYRQEDKRIKMLNNEVNMGIAYSLNKGISQARGRYIARMDADDISLPDRLAKQVEFLEANCDIGLTGCWFFVINEKGELIIKVPHFCNHEDIYKFSLTSSSLCHGSVMGRTKIFKEFNGYDSPFEPAEDYHLWLRIMEKYKIANIPEYLYTYRIHQESITSKNEELMSTRADEVRLGAMKRRGWDEQGMLEFSESWFERCFYHSYGDIVRNKNIVIVGTQSGAIKAVDVLKKLNCAIAGILDDGLCNDKGLVGGYRVWEWEKLPCLSYDYIVVASRAWKEIKQEIAIQNIPVNKIVYSFMA